MNTILTIVILVLLVDFVICFLERKAYYRKNKFRYGAFLKDYWRMVVFSFGCIFAIILGTLRFIWCGFCGIFRMVRI